MLTRELYGQLISLNGLVQENLKVIVSSEISEERITTISSYTITGDEGFFECEVDKRASFLVIKVPAYNYQIRLPLTQNNKDTLVAVLN